MGPVQAITTCLNKYATFSGRASRSEFWWWTGALFLSLLVAFALDYALFQTASEQATAPFGITDTLLFAILIPDMAVTARRLQDFSVFGAWIPVLVIPAHAVSILVGTDTPAAATLQRLDTVLVTAQLAIMALCLKPSAPGPNRYGPNPHEVTP